MRPNDTPRQARLALRTGLLAAVASVALLVMGVSPAYAVGTSYTPTWGADARVWTVAESGGVAYLGGDFQNLVDTSGHSQASPYLGAIDLSTGQPESWNPNVNGSVYKILISGTTMYIGGNFTSVGGATHNHIAAFDISTPSAPSLITTFVPKTTDIVWDLATDGVSTLYAGGVFTRAGTPGVVHQRIAAFDSSTGAVDNNFNANANSTVRALTYMNGVLYVGGYFCQVNGQGVPAPCGSSAFGTAEYHIVAVDGATGSLLPWAYHPTTNSVPDTMTNDGTDVYIGYNGIHGTGFHGMGSYTAVGVQNWVHHTCGDVQGMALEDANLYIGGHIHCIEQDSIAPRQRLGAVQASDGTILPWGNPLPTANIGCTSGCLGVWALYPTSNDGLVIGGDFTRVNGKLQPRFGYLPPASS
jgi:hypothetical protein